MKRVVVLCMLALLAPAAAFAHPFDLDAEPGGFGGPIRFAPTTVGSTSTTKVVIRNAGSNPLIILKEEIILNSPGSISPGLRVHGSDAPVLHRHRRGEDLHERPDVHGCGASGTFRVAGLIAG